MAYAVSFNSCLYYTKKNRGSLASPSILQNPLEKSTSADSIPLTLWLWNLSFRCRIKRALAPHIIEALTTALTYLAGRLTHSILTAGEIVRLMTARTYSHKRIAFLWRGMIHLVSGRSGILRFVSKPIVHKLFFSEITLL